jgi:hypothetical protein
MSQVQKFSIRLRGVRPLLFDRYAGDNKTKLSPENKLYLEDGFLTIPSLNIFSLLSAENTKSACKMFFGKQWQKIAQGIKANVDINPVMIQVLDENGPVKFNGFDGKKLEVVQHVARLAKGVPNPKERPKLNLPWAVEFSLSYFKNSDCSLGNLRQAIEEGGTLGLGTFRPFFGTYEVEKWDEIG